jgi:hypothetical protein
MNKAAQALGRLAKGKPKKFSEVEIKRRTERLKNLAMPARWPDKKED